MYQRIEKDAPQGVLVVKRLFGRRAVPLHLSGFPCPYQRRVEANAIHPKRLKYKRRMRTIRFQNIIRLYQHIGKIRSISLVILWMVIFNMVNLRIRNDNRIRRDAGRYNGIDRAVNFTNNMHEIYVLPSSLLHPDDFFPYISLSDA